MGGKTRTKRIKSKVNGKATKNTPKKQLVYKPNKSTKGHLRNMPKNKLNKKWLIIGIVSVVAIIAILVIVNHKSYEQYDLKGLTVKEACEKARGAGWKVDSIHHIESYSDTTDCYNERLVVSGYDYWRSGGSVEIVFGKEGEKQAECEASGKWYRNSQCKTQEEWENEYAWSNAHAACKKYGSSGYAKTLTDCYVGSEYKGPVSGEATVNSTSDSTSSGSSSNTSNASWRQVLSDYEKWMDSYIDFMKRYKNADSSAIGSMLSDYSRLINEMTEWNKKLNNVRGGLSTSDLTEYIQTLARINKKMEELY